MNEYDDIANWLAFHPLTPIYIDCVTAMMLKILVGSYKISPEMRRTMVRLYDYLWDRPGELFDDARMHKLISGARSRGTNHDLVWQLDEARRMAETRIPGPVMRDFKSMLHAEGLLSSGMPV